MRKCKFLFAVLAVTISAWAQNYDESKIPAYTLPSLFPDSLNQNQINKSSWERSRRHEVRALFRNNVYGQMPKTYDNLQFIVTNEVPDAMGGKAGLKEVAITVW